MLASVQRKHSEGMEGGERKDNLRLPAAGEGDRRGMKEVVGGGFEKFVFSH